MVLSWSGFIAIADVLVLLLPVALGLECKSELNEPSDGWALFRATGLSYHYYDLSKKTAVQVT